MKGDRLLYACQRSSATYVEPCDDCPGCRQVEQSTKAALRRRAERAEMLLHEIRNGKHSLPGALVQIDRYFEADS